MTFRFNTGNFLCNVVIFNRAFMKQHLNINTKVTVIGKYDSKYNTLTASDITGREKNLALAQKLVANLHDAAGITEPVNAEIQTYFGRDILVIYADDIASAVAEKLAGTPLAHLPLIGTFSQVANFTVLSDDPQHRERILKFLE